MGMRRQRKGKLQQARRQGAMLVVLGEAARSSSHLQSLGHRGSLHHMPVQPWSQRHWRP